MIAAAGVLAAGALVAVLLGSNGDSPAPERQPAGNDTPPKTTTTEPPRTTTTTTTTEETAPSAPDGASLNDQGFALMQDGEYDEALPLFEQAVDVLEGSGSLAEAYASYNLAFTRFALGSCDGVIELLDHSEAIQGKRKEIDALARDWEKTCGDGGKGNGKGNGKGQDDEDD